MPARCSSTRRFTKAATREFDHSAAALALPAVPVTSMRLVSSWPRTEVPAFTSAGSARAIFAASVIVASVVARWTRVLIWLAVLKS